MQFIRAEIGIECEHGRFQMRAAASTSAYARGPTGPVNIRLAVDIFGGRGLLSHMAMRLLVLARILVPTLAGPATAALATLSARYAGVDVTLDLCAVPEEADCVFVVNVHSGERWAVPAGRVQLLRIS